MGKMEMDFGTLSAIGLHWNTQHVALRIQLNTSPFVLGLWFELGWQTWKVWPFLVNLCWRSYLQGRKYGRARTTSEKVSFFFVKLALIRQNDLEYLSQGLEWLLAVLRSHIVKIFIQRWTICACCNSQMPITKAWHQRLLVPEVSK